MDIRIKQLRTEMKLELENNILPFWMHHMIDSENGGFYGRITGKNELDRFTSKGAILNARILWTFSAAYRLLKKDQYLSVATRAKRYVIDKFYDSDYGGIYWELDCNGNPLNTKKQIYALGFVIYGLSEYHRATGDREALEYAILLFNDIENYSYDKENNGYNEALSREWNELADVRLSMKDENTKKTTNTHLHILESYTNLYRIWKNERLKSKLANLVELFIYEIIDDKTKHLKLFFDEQWNNKNSIISYGHDIETSWLLYEATLVLNDNKLLTQIELLTFELVNAASEGFLHGAGMLYEFKGEENKIDADRHWWVQAEATVGYINLYQNFGDKLSLTRAISCWDFIKKYLVDNNGGEWFWSIRSDGTVNSDDDKAGFWKCPYHNGRMCMEIIERFS